MVKVSGTATVKQTKTGEIYEIEGEQLNFKRVNIGKRSMGAQTMYYGVLAHPQIGEITWLFKYPADAKSNHLLETPYELIKNNLHFDFSGSEEDEGETIVYGIFSERERIKRGPSPYQYDKIPENLRHQVLYILEDAIKFLMWSRSGQLWEDVWDFYCREKGISREENYARIAKTRCCKIITGDDMEATFDIIEIIFYFMAVKGAWKDDLEKSAGELNRLFRKESLGYQLNGIQMMKIDSEHFHQEVVEPVLDFLQGDNFKAANKRFRDALKKYRSGEYRHCIDDAYSAFESVMRVICKRRGWRKKGTADDLIKVLEREKFIPSYLRSYFALGLPPVRHNQGAAHEPLEPVELPAYVAARFALHLAATNILFLIQRNENFDDN